MCAWRLSFLSQLFVQKGHWCRRLSVETAVVTAETTALESSDEERCLAEVTGFANGGAGRMSIAVGRTAGARGLTDAPIAGVDAVVDGGRGRRELNASDLLGMLISLVGDAVTTGSVTSAII